jgi:hypothetical protein
MKKAKYDQKSGVTSTGGEYTKMHGGLPTRKSVEEIEKVNSPRKNPNAIGK